MTINKETPNRDDLDTFIPAGSFKRVTHMSRLDYTPYADK